MQGIEQEREDEREDERERDPPPASSLSLSASSSRGCMRVHNLRLSAKLIRGCTMANSITGVLRAQLSAGFIGGRTPAIIKGLRRA